MDKEVKLNEEIESLETAIRVLRSKSEELCRERNLKLCEESKAYKDKKTRKLATYFSRLGYQVLEWRPKEEAKPEDKVARLAWKIGKEALDMFKSLAKKSCTKALIDLKEKDGVERSDWLNLCEQMKSLKWIDYTKEAKVITLRKLASKTACRFWNGGWAEQMTKQIAVRTLSSFATKHKLPYDVFTNVKLRRWDNDKELTDMELDVVVSLKDRFYIFESKTGYVLGIDKWVDRSRMFAADGKSRFFTCVSEEGWNPLTFKPFDLVRLSELEKHLYETLEAENKIP